MMKYTNIEPFTKILGSYIGEIFMDVTTLYICGVYPYYMLSNFGRLYHKALGRMISLGLSTSGYLSYPFSTSNGTRMVQIHRLEMLIFAYIPGCEELDVNHKDGNKLNNFIGNLEWMTRKENIQHSYDTGLHPTGEDKTNASITNEQAIQICELLSMGIGPTDIAKMLNVKRTVVQSIRTRKCWTNISKDYEFTELRARCVFDDDTVRNICEYFSKHEREGFTVNDLCRNALVSIGLEGADTEVDSARKIYTRTHYTRISKDYVF